MSTQLLQVQTLTDKVPDIGGSLVIHKGTIVTSLLGKYFVRGYLFPFDHHAEAPNFVSGRFTKEVFLRLELKEDNLKVQLIDAEDGEVYATVKVVDLLKTLALPPVK